MVVSPGTLLKEVKIDRSKHFMILTVEEGDVKTRFCWLLATMLLILFDPRATSTEEVAVGKVPGVTLNIFCSEALQAAKYT